MIATRSASSAASSMSCVVRRRVTLRVAQLAQAVPDEETRRRVEAGRRLVEEEHARRVHERAGDHHALRLPAREEVGLVPRAVEQAELVEQLVGPPLALARRDAVVGGVEDQVVADRDRAVEVAAAAARRRAAPGPAPGSRTTSTPPMRAAPGGRPDAGRQHPDGRRLSGPVRAEQPEHLARGMRRRTRRRPRSRATSDTA